MTDNRKNSYTTGIDIGSTTVKVAICNDAGIPVFLRYRRHNAMPLGTVISIMKDANEMMGNIMMNLRVTGSLGISIAESFDLPFIQEVVASAELIKAFHPEVRTFIEIGGEDSKILFFDDFFRPDIRMNGSCAGGTGAFIDQMAALLGTPLEELNGLAERGSSKYAIASRCGVFAKTDIQALLSNRASREDIAASVFQAVALQSITTLVRGSEVRRKVIFAGGPLKFFPQLRKAFINILDLNMEQDVIIPQYPEFIPAMGAAMKRLPAGGAGFLMDIQSLIQKIEKENLFYSRETGNRLPCLFQDSSDLKAWEERHKRYQIKKVDLSRTGNKNCFLGIDSGSTTTKIVLIDDEKNVILTHYVPNNGDPIHAVKKGLQSFQEEFRRAGFTPTIAKTAVTGYGEELVKAAFALDCGVVETMAHYRAARFFDKDVSFILDIGGQDMKAIYIDGGAVSDIQINEACSSGCGSFIETFAQSLGYNVSDFAGIACRKNKPYDLGTRCTVFMNSKVKQALRENATVSDISAGLAYSVVKNALYKVLKLKDPETLGKKIVVQGGTFRNPAVLRAFEILLGREVIRPDISELMGAYGAALTALQGYRTDLSGISQFTGFEPFGQGNDFTAKTLQCKGCENRCSVTKLLFENGKSYFTGMRCERKFSNESTSKEHGENLVASKFKLLFERKKDPEGSPILTFGIPRALNMYENFPFWCDFLTECGFKVVLSDPSGTGLFEKGAGTIMSDNICFPAKLAHGHAVNLMEKGVDRILYPTVVYEKQEYSDAVNSFNCPVVTGYPDVLKSSIDPEEKYGIPIDNPVISFKNVSLLKKQLYLFVRQFGISKKLLCRAIDKGIKAHLEYKKQLQEMAADIIDTAETKNRTLVVLAGRPYHTDPLVNHGIPESLAGMGVDVIPEDAVPLNTEVPLKNSGILTQWSYANKLLAAAKYVAGGTGNIQLVQITSFGCGLDAIAADETRKMIKEAGKIYTLIKVDEISSLGAVKIRLQSMIEALKESRGIQQRGNIEHAKSTMPERCGTTVIVPWFSDFYSPPIPAISESVGYRIEVLPPPDRDSVDVGLKYVNNDMCYPAVIVIGDIIKALQSRTYDPKRTVVMLPQTGGQCRASSYLALARKALINAGFGNVPVLSLSIHSDNPQPGVIINKKRLIRQAGLGIIFADALARMYLATTAREVNPGKSKAVHSKYLTLIEKGIEEADFKYLLNLLKEAVSEFNSIAVVNESGPVVGVLGEIYVKYNSFSNNNIVEWLIGQGVEVVLPPLTGFFTQWFINEEFDHKAYLKHSMADKLLSIVLDRYTRHYLYQVDIVMQNFRHYRKSFDLKELAEAASKVTSLANQAGEGWLLPAEMIALLENGISNIVCLQPFGCIANQITGSGVARRLKTLYPQLNLLSINMDAGASEVNILNRLHFIVMAAKEEANVCQKESFLFLSRKDSESRVVTRDISVLKEDMLLEIRKWQSRVSEFVMR